MTIKYSHIVLSIISISFLASVILLGYFTWPSADDFSLASSIIDKGILGHIITNYLNWDGRMISLGIVQTLLIRFLPIPFVNIIWGVCLILSAFLLLKIFNFNLNSKTGTLDFTTKIILTALFAIILWYGMKAHISQTVYWATGGAYIFGFLLSLIWLYNVIKILKAKVIPTGLKLVLLLLFTLYVGAMSYNLSCSLMAYIAIEFIILISSDTKYNKKPLTIFLVSIFIFLFIGTLAITLAPGNFKRASFGSHSFVINPIIMINNYIEVTKSYFQWSFVLMLTILSALPQIILITCNGLKISIPKKIKLNLPKYLILDFSKSGFINSIRVYQYPLAALASIIPFTIVSDFASPRTSIYFMEFIVLWLVTIIIPKLINIISNYKSKPSFINAAFYSPFLILYLIVFQYMVVSHILILSDLKNKVNLRESYIQKYNNQDVDLEVDKIDAKLPFTFEYNDITTNPKYWVNTKVANYYKIKSIRTTSSQTQ